MYSCGRYGATIDFDPGPGVFNLSSIVSLGNFILKLDSNGLFKSAYQFEYTESFGMSGMYVGGSGNLYLGGYFNRKADFDLGLGSKEDSSLGKRDLYTLRLSSCLLNSSLSLNECKYFKYGGRIFDSSEVYEVLIAGKNGCDSLVTVSLTVKTVNDTITTAGSVISAKSTAATSYQWVNGPSYSAIAGATSASYTATATGNYALIITEKGCTDTSDCMNVIGLGIKDATNGLAVSVYPNPSKGVFHIQFAQSTQAKVAISSMEGRLLEQSSMDGTEYKIDLSNLSSGVYFLNISTKDGVQKTIKLLRY